jgi:16S rRNA (cytosine1402-N4)-methyltransferase
MVDGTFGGGGHAYAIHQRVLPNGSLIGIDRDPRVNGFITQRTACEQRPLIGIDRDPRVNGGSLEPLEINLSEIPRANSLVRISGSYDELPEILLRLGHRKVQGILLDLGLSSDQLADPARGFSFNLDGPLDLRFDDQHGEPAWEWLKRASEKVIADTIYRYGEERFSRRIARKIVEVRQRASIRTTSELALLVRSCVPRSKNHRIDPATRTFQALRIQVNDELGILERALRRLPDCLSPGGRIGIISFHSLEDRLVKHGFRNDSRLTVLTRKPIEAGEAEQQSNSRSRSAKLRVAERTREPLPDDPLIA